MLKSCRCGKTPKVVEKLFSSGINYRVECTCDIEDTWWLLKHWCIRAWNAEDNELRVDTNKKQLTLAQRITKWVRRKHM